MCPHQNPLRVYSTPCSSAPLSSHSATARARRGAPSPSSARVAWPRSGASAARGQSPACPPRSMQLSEALQLGPALSRRIDTAWDEESEDEDSVIEGRESERKIRFVIHAAEQWPGGGLGVRTAECVDQQQHLLRVPPRDRAILPPRQRGHAKARNRRGRPRALARSGL
jgi:hypothetical protein